LGSTKKPPWHARTHTDFNFLNDLQFFLTEDTSFPSPENQEETIFGTPGGTEVQWLEQGTEKRPPPSRESWKWPML
ncbi:MAG: hypothetical protein Q8881_04340, partial [Sweet potato little leaf phytoplasma]|nr:hypothetical protein [Sweet potato little leaf phytoplasma]